MESTYFPHIALRNNKFFDSRDGVGLVAKVSGEEPIADFDAREVTPIEYIPYKRFNDHLESQEARAKKIHVLVMISAGALMVIACCTVAAVLHFLG